MQDVVIIGGGVTGLAATLELQQRGYRTALASDQLTSPSASSSAAGMAVGGQIDNFTRVSHAHGFDFARELWRFGDRAFLALLTFCEQHQIPYSRGHRYRLITSEAELIECELATKQLKAAGFSVNLTLKTEKTWPSLSNRVLAVQDDGFFGAYVNQDALLKKMNSLVAAQRLGAVKALNSNASGVELLLRSGEQIKAEIAVLACHLQMGDLLPNLKSALVSVADQWSPVECRGFLTTPWAKPGVVYSANNTYEWGVTTSTRSLRLGGGRYLRPMAGIEAKSAVFEEKIASHVIEQYCKTFTNSEISKIAAGEGAAGLDCRPCDELPIIGPMYGDDRILVGTGYMGSGLTQGFLAGRCLAELIDTGKSELLPRRVWPERLRSLAG